MPTHSTTTARAMRSQSLNTWTSKVKKRAVNCRQRKLNTSHDSASFWKHSNHPRLQRQISRWPNQQNIRKANLVSNASQSAMPNQQCQPVFMNHSKQASTSIIQFPFVIKQTTKLKAATNLCNARDQQCSTKPVSMKHRQVICKCPRSICSFKCSSALRRSINVNNTISWNNVSFNRPAVSQSPGPCQLSCLGGFF